MTKLSELNIGQVATVEKMELDSLYSRRLSTLGLTAGTPISVIERNGGGAVIVRTRGSRYALGKKFAEKIFVNKIV